MHSGASYWLTNGEDVQSQAEVTYLLSVLVSPFSVELKPFGGKKLYFTLL